MSSVADELRVEDRQALAALDASERIRLALALGRRDLRIFCRARGLDPYEARLRLRRQRQVGRLPSRCMTDGDAP